MITCPVYNQAATSAYVYKKCRCGTCKKVKADSDHRYHELHEDEIKDTKEKFRRLYPEVVKQWKRNDYDLHREEYIERAARNKVTPTGVIADKNWRLRKRYGLSVEEVQSMYESQHGRCAICFTEIMGRNRHIDHDHLTGKVRGILCQKCNMGLGSFDDNQIKLQAAINYLIKHN
jgi:hypothetical protein